MERKRVGVIGLGPMGTAMVRVLAAAGHDLHVWNRTRGRAEVLAGSATICDTPTEAVRGADVVIVTVLDQSAARAVIEDAGDAARGPVVVNLSSDSPAAARSVAEYAGRADLRYLAGAMLTPSSMVGEAGSTMLIAGPDPLIERASDVLAVLAPEVVGVGDDPSVAAAYDLALLDAFWTTVAGWCHALALARVHGLRAADVTERLTAIVGLATSVGATISTDADRGDHPGDVSTVDSARATLDHIVAATRDARLDDSIPAAVHGLLRATVDAGHASDGPSRMVDTVRRGVAGIPVVPGG